MLTYTVLSTQELKQLVVLRKTLHQYPELSEQESETAHRIHDFLKGYQPDEIITELGGHGLAAIWNGDLPGKTILIRAELDALPIQESNSFEHRSKSANTSHKCGHDGHMTILCGLAMLLKKHPLHTGRVILLFQPAEETGQGAKAVITDSRFENIKPDYAFALHNLPKHNMGVVYGKKGVFCAASTGLKVRLKGITAHASQPETGRNPALATAQLIHCLDRIIETNDFLSKTLITLTHTQIGEKSFGVSAGESEVWLTLRAHDKHDFDLLKMLIEREAQFIGKQNELDVTLDYHESFDVTENHSEGVDMVKLAAAATKMPYLDMITPNPWSEDFGLFLKTSKGAMFGLGSGQNTPDLHNPDYDFPDELIETGTKIFWELIHSTHQ